MATNGTATDGTAQVSEISIDLLDAVEQADPTRATLSIPHERAQTVRATVRPAEGGRWRCEFHVDRSSATVSRAPDDKQCAHILEVLEVLKVLDIPEWVVPVLDVVETLVTEAGC